MLKAVIDINVFVSGLLKSPSARRVIKALEGLEFILVISPEILDELIGVIARPKFHNIITREVAARLIEVVKAQALLARPSLRLNIVKDDPDDDRFLEAAITAKVDFLVSGDDHLLSIKSFRHIRIVTPTEFIKELRKIKP